MSYQYRKTKRLRAHRILRDLRTQLIKDYNNQNFDFTYIDVNKIYSRTPSDQPAVFGILMMLYDNKHITARDEENWFDAVRINEEGIEALNEGYYLVLNRKDRLESIELYTKWILPIVSMIIAIMAYSKK